MGDIMKSMWGYILMVVSSLEQFWNTFIFVVHLNLEFSEDLFLQIT